MRTRALLRITFAVALAGCVASTASSAPVKQKPVRLRTEAVTLAPPPPANDNCAAAIAISSFPYTNVVDTTGATDEVGEPASICAAQSHSVWYTIGPFPTAQTVYLATEGSDFDTAVQVLTGSCGAQTVIACDDDGGTGALSKIVFQAAPGTVYYIQAGGFSISTGNLVLSVNAGVGVPTLSLSAMAALALLLAGAAILVLRLRN